MEEKIQKITKPDLALFFFQKDNGRKKKTGLDSRELSAFLFFIDIMEEKNRKKSYIEHEIKKGGAVQASNFFLHPHK